MITISIIASLFVVAIFHPISVLGQNTTGNLTLGNTTIGTGVENATDIGKTSSLDGFGGGGGGGNNGGNCTEGGSNDGGEFGAVEAVAAIAMEIAVVQYSTMADESVLIEG